MFHAGKAFGEEQLDAIIEDAGGGSAMETRAVLAFMRHGGTVRKCIQCLVVLPVIECSVETVRRAWFGAGVMVFRDQELSPESQVAFSRRFGNPIIHVRKQFLLAGHPEILMVSNKKHADGTPHGFEDAGRYWHSDLCYLAKPSKLTILHALEVPTKDGVTYGATQFAGTVAAYDALSEAMKQHLDGLRGANSYRYMWNRKAKEFGVRPLLSEAELQKYPPDAIHPVVRTHPETGQRSLFVNHVFTREIIGL